MEKKDCMKAFLAGMLSMAPIFKTIDVEKNVIGTNDMKPVKVKIRTVAEDVASCFDDVGNKLRSAMEIL